MKVIGAFGSSGNNSGQSNMSADSSSLNRAEFMDKFYKKESIREKKGSFNTKETILTSQMGLKRKMSGDFREKHAKLFERVCEKIVSKTPNKSATLFGKFREDYSDPFEMAKHSKATVGQIKLINFSIFALCLFGLLTSARAWDKENEEDFSAQLTTLLIICMFTSLMSIACFVVRLKLQVELQIHRKQAHKNSKVFNIFRKRDIFAQI
jgi:hypothetical protein